MRPLRSPGGESVKRLRVNFYFLLAHARTPPHYLRCYTVAELYSDGNTL